MSTEQDSGTPSMDSKCVKYFRPLLQTGFLRNGSGMNNPEGLSAPLFNKRQEPPSASPARNRLDFARWGAQLNLMSASSPTEDEGSTETFVLRGLVATSESFRDRVGESSSGHLAAHGVLQSFQPCLQINTRNSVI